MIAITRLEGSLIFADVGMDALTSTLAFSRFAALQVVTWGHPDTTGSPMIDAFLSSEHLETANGQDQYTETLLKLSTLGITYERPTLGKEYRKTRRDFGLRADKHLYCCPQTLFKFHPEFDLVLGVTRPLKSRPWQCWNGQWPNRNRIHS